MNSLYKLYKENGKQDCTSKICLCKNVLKLHVTTNASVNQNFIFGDLMPKLDMLICELAIFCTQLQTASWHIFSECYVR